MFGIDMSAPTCYERANVGGAVGYRVAGCVLAAVVACWPVPGHAAARLPARLPAWVDPITGRPGCELVVESAVHTGWPDHTWPTLVAIAAAESGCRRDAVHRGAGEVSVGPLQINIAVHPISVACAQQYHCSSRFARTLYASRGWSPWTAYRRGRHRPYMPAAQQLVRKWNRSSSR